MLLKAKQICPKDPSIAKALIAVSVKHQVFVPRLISLFVYPSLVKRESTEREIY